MFYGKYTHEILITNLVFMVRMLICGLSPTRNGPVKELTTSSDTLSSFSTLMRFAGRS